jgi:hypothetical protein
LRRLYLTALATAVTLVAKTERIIIRCSPELKREFRLLAAGLGARNYEELLRKLIEKARSEWLAAGGIY